MVYGQKPNLTLSHFPAPLPLHFKFPAKKKLIQVHTHFHNPCIITAYCATNYDSVLFKNDNMNRYHVEPSPTVANKN